MGDIALDENDDVQIANGDFVATESTVQHQRQLLLNRKGEFKQNPEACVGALEFIDEEGLQALIRAVSIEFAKDGMDVEKIAVNPDGTLQTKATYR